MAKQKCGTCRFFQDAGLAGSGWCHHPQRKVSSGVMIMVRQNELACRDEWSRSLWTPGQGVDEAEKPFQRPSLLGPAPPANVENVRKLLIDDALAAASSAQGEDVLLSEARIVSEVIDSAAESDRPPNAGGFDPRSAVFRAREAYRERSRARESAARLSAGAEAIGTRQQLDVSRKATEASEAGALAVGVAPSLAGQAFSRAAMPREKQPSVDHAGLDSPQQIRHSYQPKEPTNLATEPEAWALAEPDATSAATRVRGSHAADLAEELVEDQSGPPMFDREPVLDLAKLDEIDETNLPEWFRSDLPRMCRTCRDFRPSADGGRGWCANAWAFTHRRLVQEEDLAPCDSSIGDWWVPVDDVWLVAADVSSHGRATPLLDRLSAPPSERRRRS